MQKKILISACLLGKNCRHDGGHSHISDLDETDLNWIPVCPEEAGGLGTPRPAAELQEDAEKIIKGKGSIININRQDVTQNFIKGAEESLEKGLMNGVEFEQFISVHIYLYNILTTIVIIFLIKIYISRVNLLIFPINKITIYIFIISRSATR